MATKFSDIPPIWVVGSTSPPLNWVGSVAVLINRIQWKYPVLVCWLWPYETGSFSWDTRLEPWAAMYEVCLTVLLERPWGRALRACGEGKGPSFPVSATKEASMWMKLPSSPPAQLIDQRDTIEWLSCCPIKHKNCPVKLCSNSCPTGSEHCKMIAVLSTKFWGCLLHSTRLIMNTHTHLL